MAPQLATGGWMPRPRKLKTDSSRITLPTDRVVATRIGDIAFGRIWRNMMRAAVAPCARAASTKARSFSDRVAPRTSRAVVVQPTSAMMATMR